MNNRNPKPGRRGVLRMTDDDNWSATVDGCTQTLMTGTHVNYIRTGMFFEGPSWPFYVLERDAATGCPEYLVEVVSVDANGNIRNVPSMTSRRRELLPYVLATAVAANILAAGLWLASVWGWL
jgi:hypothetical protein